MLTLLLALAPSPASDALEWAPLGAADLPAGLVLQEAEPEQEEAPVSAVPA